MENKLLKIVQSHVNLAATTRQACRLKLDRADRDSTDYPMLQAAYLASNFRYEALYDCLDSLYDSIGGKP